MLAKKKMSKLGLGDLRPEAQVNKQICFALFGTCMEGIEIIVPWSKLKTTQTILHVMELETTI